MTSTVSSQGILIRFLIALVLVYATYNPERFSYVHWVSRAVPDAVSPMLVLAGVVLIIGWTIYVRATRRSLGPLGLILTVAFFVTVTWLIVDVGIVPANSARALTHIVLVVLAAVLAVGMSWSGLRRRFSGQADVDDLDD